MWYIQLGPKKVALSKQFGFNTAIDYMIFGSDALHGKMLNLGSLKIRGSGIFLIIAHNLYLT